MKPLLEKEVLLAAEYINTLNQESLLTAVGFGYFAGHMETVLQFGRCWNPTSVIHSSGWASLVVSFSSQWPGVPA